MNIRRSLVAVLALAALGATPALSQNRGAAMLERQQAFVDTVVGQFELPAEQEKAFRAVMAEQVTGLQAIFKEYQGQYDPQMREDVTALRDETDTKLETVFSDEQMATFITMRDEHRAQFRRGHQPPPVMEKPKKDSASAMAPQGGPGPARMMERLRAEGDEITIELLARAEAAHVLAREAFQAGDTDAAQIRRQEAMAYMHTAVRRTFPEMADRMGQGMKGCQAKSDAGSCGMCQGGMAGRDGGSTMQGHGMMRGMGNGEGQGMMHGKGQGAGKGQGMCRAQQA